MKTFLFVCAFSALAFASPNSFASAVPAGMSVNQDVVAHGGGCRKDSPPGQCCHAGSKPYHCH